MTEIPRLRARNDASFVLGNDVRLTRSIFARLTASASDSAACLTFGAPWIALITATPSTPARITAPAFATSMPPMPTDGRPAAAACSARADEAKLRLGVGFRGRPEHRAETDVVGAATLRRDDIRHRQRREADDHVAADQAPGGVQRQIVHPDVNPVRVRRDRDIDAVIDEEQRPRGAATVAEGDGQVVHLPARHALGA